MAKSVADFHRFGEETAELGYPAPGPKRLRQAPIETLKTQTDVLRFAAGLEQGAASGYLGMVPVLGDRDLAKAVASILGDEAMHWAILRQALGENPVPEPFIS